MFSFFYRRWNVTTYPLSGAREEAFVLLCWLQGRPSPQLPESLLTVPEEALHCCENKSKGPLNPEGGVLWHRGGDIPWGALPISRCCSENCPLLPRAHCTDARGRHLPWLTGRGGLPPRDNCPDSGLVTSSLGLNSFDCKWQNPILGKTEFIGLCS